MHIEIYTGESIARNLNELGVSAIFKERATNCTTTKYHFDLANINHLTKLKKALVLLSAHLHTEVRQSSTKKAHFCLEIENEDRYFPTYKETWWNIEKCPSSAICFGYNENMEDLTREIEELPHMLVAGTTGSGKSTFLKSVILNLHFKNDCSLILIDPKRIEFSQFKNSNKLATPIVTAVDDAVKILNTLCEEMDKRYCILEKEPTRKFNKFICIIDELADLMLTSGKAVEEPIVRIAQKGRACGIHLILATQRPTVNVVTGLIKANMPTRVAFATASNRDSMTMIDKGGAEKLLGKGDCLVKLPDRVDLIRIQAPFVTAEDIEAVMPDTPKEWECEGNRRMAEKSSPKPPKTTWLDKLLGKVAKWRGNAQNGAENPIDTLNNIDCIDDDE